MLDQLDGLPPALAAEPQLWPENADAWNCFHDLSGSRPVGFALGSIPIGDILHWASMMSVEPAEDHYRKVCAMDREFLAFHHEKEATR